MVDSLQKRVNFLNTVINSIQLKDIKALHERVENLEVKHYDIITTRAVANLSKLLQYTNKLIDTKTLFIPLKANIEDELKVDFNFIEAGVSTIFVYKKNNSYYIEQPYNGIYQISGDEYNSIEKLDR